MRSTPEHRSCSFVLQQGNYHISSIFPPPAQARQFCYLGHTSCEVMNMSYVNPALRPKFETLPIDLKNEILARDVTLSNLNDLIHVLQEIVDEAEAAP